MKMKRVGQFEFRVRCAHHREEGHRTHVYRANSPQVVGPLNANPFQRACQPWVYEARLVTDWTDQVDDLETRALRLASVPNLFDVAP